MSFVLLSNSRTSLLRVLGFTEIEKLSPLGGARSKRSALRPFSLWLVELVIARAEELMLRSAKQ